MNLAAAFADSVQRHAEKTALFWDELALSYSELWSQSLFVAGVLRQQFGVNAGDRIGLWLKNCPEYIPALFGILQAGAVVVPINNFLKPEEVSFILGDAGIDLVVGDAGAAAHFQALKAGKPSLKLMNVENVLASFPLPPGDVNLKRRF